MGKLDDLTGRRFGRLVVIDRAESKRTPSGQIKTMWNCKCDCGNTKVVNSQHLKNGDISSCGCLEVRDYRPVADLTGLRFNHLTVIKEVEARRCPSGQLKRRWACKCDCGNSTVVDSQGLTSGRIKSCGCRKGLHIHDLYNTRIYHIHQHIIARCERPGSDNYQHYGGRGIKVCEEWHDVVVFAKWAYENGYSDTLSIDRIDVNGNYEPSNCRWVDSKVQANNKRLSIWIEYEGETHTLAEWAELLNIPYDTLYHYRRFNKDLQAAIKHFKEGRNERRKSQSDSKAG